jgi:hypothetical protein
MSTLILYFISVDKFFSFFNFYLALNPFNNKHYEGLNNIKNKFYMIADFVNVLSKFAINSFNNFMLIN